MLGPSKRDSGGYLFIFCLFTIPVACLDNILSRRRQNYPDDCIDWEAAWPREEHGWLPPADVGEGSTVDAFLGYAHSLAQALDDGLGQSEEAGGLCGQGGALPVGGDVLAGRH